MTVLKTLTTGLIATLLILGVSACDRQGPAEKAGEEIDETYNEVKEDTREAAEDTREAAEEAGEYIEKQTSPDNQ